VINTARDAMREAAARITAAQASRLRLADDFESVVMAMSEQVATASTQLSASAAGLTQAASAASTEVSEARETITSLTRSSTEIRQIIAVIDSVADQTAQATERVTAQVQAIRAACDDVAAVMSSVGTRVVDMNGLVDGIAAAVDGSANVAQDDSDVTGLSRMAERLRSEMTGLLAEMRS
jgi:methyl-accepting chemotaxis protein